MGEHVAAVVRGQSFEGHTTRDNTPLRFGDVLDLKFGCLRHGAQPRAACLTHGCKCRLGVEPPGARRGALAVEGAGPTCCPFSVAGKRKKALGEFKPGFS